MAEIIPIEPQDKDEYIATLKDAKYANKVVIVDFHAQWCGPCKLIAPKLKEHVKDMSNVVVLTLDVDEASEVAEKLQITSMPTFRFYINGENIPNVEEVIGASIDRLKERIAAARAAL